MDNVEFYEAFAPFYEQVYACVDAVETVRQWLSLLESNGFVPPIDKRRTNAPKLIDIGCGPGWHLSAWGANGFVVAGLDSSQTMLMLAKKHFLKAFRDKQCPLIHRDIRRLGNVNGLENSFDIAVSHFNFPNLFPTEDLASLFLGARVLVRQGGVWAFDHALAPPTSTNLADSEALAAGSVTFVRSGRFDPAKGLYEQHWSGKGLDMVENYWFHNVRQMGVAAELAGWELRDRYEWHPYEAAGFWTTARAESQRVISIYCRV